jgi:Protein of unknown function (DUF3292)
VGKLATKISSVSIDSFRLLQSAALPPPSSSTAEAINMPTPGYYFRDSGTTPPAEEESETRRRQLGVGSHSKSPLSSTISPPTSPTRNSPPQEKTTDSHDLAQADHDVKGAAQLAGRTAEVTDLGWRSPPKEIDTLVGGLPNEELWVLVRRFNRVCTQNSSRCHVLTLYSKCIMSKLFQ